MQRRTSSVAMFLVHLQIPHPSGAVLIDFKADEFSSAKEWVDRQVPGAELIPAHRPGNGASYFVFHNDFEHGELPIGWLAAVVVPTDMAPTAVIERRTKTAQAA